MVELVDTEEGGRGGGGGEEQRGEEEETSTYRRGIRRILKTEKNRMMKRKKHQLDLNLNPEMIG